MYIYKETTFNNVPVTTHRVQSVELQGDRISIHTISSTPDKVNPQSFPQTFAMPMSAFLRALYPQCVTDFLTGPGAVFEGGVVVSEEKTLDAKKVVALAQVAHFRDKAIYGGVTFEGIVYDTDPESLRNILGTAQMAALSAMQGQPFSIVWRTADNSMLNLSGDMFLSLSATVMQHVKDCYSRSWELKEEIGTATEDNIDAIDPSSGWPA